MATASCMMHVAIHLRGRLPSACWRSVQQLHSQATPNIARPQLYHLRPAPNHRIKIGLQARAASSEQEYTEISVQEAQEMVEAGATYLDVRTREEYQAGHPPEAVNVPIYHMGQEGMVPNQQFVHEVEDAIPDRDTNLVLGCKSGKRSATAWHVLHNEDFTSLANVTGGFDAWVRSGLPTQQ